MSKIKGFNNPFGLYLHIPFCQSKCNYCDFYSESYSQDSLEGYLQALSREIELYAELIPVKRLRTIYFGGGTPSLLNPTQLEGLLKLIFKKFSYPESGEITLEANPSSLNKEKIAAFHEIGINRLSLGVQSFIDQELNFLGRIHNSAQAVRIIKQIKEIFTNFNLDLIFAIPGQNLEKWKYTLKKALSFKPVHLSLYNLQIEENTPLGELYKQGKILPVNDELDARMYLLAREMLKETDYEQYEISNFAKAGFSSRHNKIYWHYQPYLGLGPAAHSFNGFFRFHNHANLKAYLRDLSLNQLPIAERFSLSKADMMAEMIFMGLRLKEGVLFRDFTDRFDLKLEDIYKKQIEKLTENGLLDINNKGIYLTEKGLLLGNEVFMEFLP